MRTVFKKKIVLQIDIPCHLIGITNIEYYKTRS